MNRHPLLSLLFFASLLLPSCVPATKVPIDSVRFGPSKPAASTLVLLLPGRGSAARSFLDEGFVKELRERRPDVDVVGVEAHLGYYRERNLPLRLREDLVVPAKKRGYRSIWLVGISMGGLGAIMYDSVYPGEVTGICALSPYLGEGTLLDEITRAGGLAKWYRGRVEEGDLERELWQRFAPYAAPQKSMGRVYLGFGTEDGFAPTNRFFGELLPPRQVVTAPGGHDYDTWRVLWDRLLSDPEFLRDGPVPKAHRAEAR